MKTKNFILTVTVSIFLFLAGSVSAQVGSEDRTMNSRYVEEQNAQRIFNLEQQLKHANSELKEIRKRERDAKNVVREAKAALRAEKKAQKARKDANSQARKTERMID